MGRTRSGLTLLPYGRDVTGSELVYEVLTDTPTDSLRVRITLDSTLPFLPGGHSFTISWDDGEPRTVHYNADLTWANCYSKMYPAGAARVIECVVDFSGQHVAPGRHTVTMRPQQTATVWHKLIIDLGGYVTSRLGGVESPHRR